MYRFMVILFSAGSAVLCGFAIYFQVMALAKYRADDFFTATRITDFAALGSCVEVITDDQLKSAGYDDVNIECTATDDDDGHKKALRNTLAVSVHPLYYAYTTGEKDYHLMHDVVRSVVSATINIQIPPPPPPPPPHAPGGVGGDDTNPEGQTPVVVATISPHVQGLGINTSSAYLALKMAAETAVPTDCDAIYNHKFDDVIADNDVMHYYAMLLKGKKEDNGDENPNFPLKNINAQCNKKLDDEDYDYSVLEEQGDQVDVTAITAKQTLMLYAHCVAQFQFASVGTDPWAGTFGIPLVGEKAGPNPHFYPWPIDFNRTELVNYNTKARMWLGLRFGLSVWAYVPMLLATCFLCADAVVFFLAEATLPDVLAETNALSPDRLSMVRDSLVMAATSKNSRRSRFAIGFAAVVAGWLFYGLFVIWPWGFVYTKLPRPICEAGEPDHVNEWGYLGTTGGWKSDWDATWYEYMIILIQAFVLFVEGIVTAPLCNPCNRLGGGQKGQAINQGIQDTAKFVTNKAQFRRLYQVFIYPLVAGVVVLIAGQAVSGARFGMAWAEGVVGKQMHTDEVTGAQRLAFDAVALSEKVYDQTVATLAITVAAGLVTGVALQRHLINGVGCFSATLFFGWLALVAIFALPLLIYANLRSVFNQDEANEDCASFPDSGYDFSKFACEARWWTFLTGGILVFGVIIIMTVFGLIEAVPSILAVRNKALVRIRKLRGFHGAFREDAANRSAAPYQDSNLDVNKHLLGGYRSHDEPFFNFKTSVSAGDTTKELLYAPRIKLTTPVVQGMPVSQR